MYSVCMFDRLVNMHYRYSRRRQKCIVICRHADYNRFRFAGNSATRGTFGDALDGGGTLSHQTVVIHGVTSEVWVVPARKVTTQRPSTRDVAVEVAFFKRRNRWRWIKRTLAALMFLITMLAVSPACEEHAVATFTYATGHHNLFAASDEVCNAACQLLEDIQGTGNEQLQDGAEASKSSDIGGDGDGGGDGGGGGSAARQCLAYCHEQVHFARESWGPLKAGAQRIYGGTLDAGFERWGSHLLMGSHFDGGQLQSASRLIGGGSWVIYLLWSALVFGAVHSAKTCLPKSIEYCTALFDSTAAFQKQWNDVHTRLENDATVSIKNAGIAKEKAIERAKQARLKEEADRVWAAGAPDRARKKKAEEDAAKAKREQADKKRREERGRKEKAARLAADAAEAERKIQVKKRRMHAGERRRWKRSGGKKQRKQRRKHRGRWLKQKRSISVFSGQIQAGVQGCSTERWRKYATRWQKG